MNDKPRSCEARQYSDQMNCQRCGLVWDTNDEDPPECLTAEQLSESVERATVDSLLDTLSDGDAPRITPADRLRQERDAALRDYKGAIEYITHKGLYADYLALTGKESPL